MADAKGKTKSGKKAGAAKVEHEKPSEAAAVPLDLANTVERDAAELALMKVSSDHATQLRDGATTLRDAETAWQKARAAGAAGSVADLRVALTEGREDLFGALRLFAVDAATQAALDEIAGVDDDDDLDSDVAPLIPLTKTHAAALVGTEVTPAHVATAFAATRSARATTRATRASAAPASPPRSRPRRPRDQRPWSLARSIATASGDAAATRKIAIHQCVVRPMMPTATFSGALHIPVMMQK